MATTVYLPSEYEIKLMKVMEALGTSEKSSAIRKLIDMFLEGELREELLRKELDEIDKKIRKYSELLNYLVERKEKIKRELDSLSKIKELENKIQQLEKENEDLKKKLEELQAKQMYTQINNINNIIIKVENTKILEVIRLVLAWIILQFIKSGKAGISLQDLMLADEYQLVEIQKKLSAILGIPIEYQTLKVLKENLNKLESLDSVFEIKDIIK